MMVLLMLGQLVAVLIGEDDVAVEVTFKLITVGKPDTDELVLVNVSIGEPEMTGEGDVVGGAVVLSGREVVFWITTLVGTTPLDGNVALLGTLVELILVLF